MLLTDPVDLAREAIEHAEGSISSLLTGRAKRVAGHLRISAKINGGWQLLATKDFGDRTTWTGDYERHAQGKEQISKRTGKPSRKVQQDLVELLDGGDTIYAGSWVSKGGTIVVAYSGVEFYFDETFAKIVIAILEGLIEHEVEQLRAVAADNNRGFFA